MVTGIRPLARLIRWGLAAAILLAFNLEQDAALAQDQAPTVILVSTAGAGRVLTDPNGWALYRWEGDQRGTSNCQSECAVAWPPYLLGETLIAPDELPGSLGFIDRGDGEWQITLDNWPLHYFAGDRQPGDINGDNLVDFGARWNVVAFGPPMASEPTPVAPTTIVVAQPNPPSPPIRPPVELATQPPASTPTRAAMATPEPSPPPVVPPTGTDTLASQSPQFSNWGPGMAAPEPEGLGQSSATAPPGASGAPSSAAAPYAAPPPPGSGAVAPYYGGCQYDLRGYWVNNGQQTTGGYRPYSASVYVRQYRIWIQAVQDDGTSYYGQCIGARLQLDVYQGRQYVGRQSGTVSASYWPAPMYGDPGQPYPAPAAICAPPLCDPVPPLYGGPTIQAFFTWVTRYGSGTETWVRR